MVRLIVLDPGIGNTVLGQWAERHKFLPRGPVIEVAGLVCQDVPNVEIPAEHVSVLRGPVVGQQLLDGHSSDCVEDYQGSQSVMAMIDGADSPQSTLVVQQEES